MITKITGEAPFQVMTSNFSISPSQEGYTLQISADGKQYSNLFTVGAGVTRLVTGVAANSYYRLSGNQSEVSINWMKVCVTEGGGSGSGTELSPVSEFPAGAEAGTVIAYSGSSSAAGIYQFDGTDWVEAGGNVDLSAYWTSAETQSAVTAVEDHLFDVEEVTASALTELHNGVLELSASTAGKANAANVSANESHFYFPTWNTQGIVTGTINNIITYSPEEAKKGQLNINGATQRQILGIDDGRTVNIWTPQSGGNPGEVLISTGRYGAPVWSAMTFPTPDVDKAYVDSAITEVQDQIDTLDEVVSEALVDLNTRKVESTSVSTIWKGTQAEFDATTQSGATADPATLYIIVNNS